MNKSHEVRSSFSEKAKILLLYRQFVENTGQCDLFTNSYLARWASRSQAHPMETTADASPETPAVEEAPPSAPDEQVEEIPQCEDTHNPMSKHQKRRTEEIQLLRLFRQAVEMGECEHHPQLLDYLVRQGFNILTDDITSVQIQSLFNTCEVGLCTSRSCLEAIITHANDWANNPMKEGWETYFGGQASAFCELHHNLIFFEEQIKLSLELCLPYVSSRVSQLLKKHQRRLLQLHHHVWRQLNGQWHRQGGEATPILVHEILPQFHSLVQQGEALIQLLRSSLPKRVLVARG